MTDQLRTICFTTWLCDKKITDYICPNWLSDRSITHYICPTWLSDRSITPYIFPTWVCDKTITNYIFPTWLCDKTITHFFFLPDYVTRQLWIKVITKLPNSEQSYKGKVQRLVPPLWCCLGSPYVIHWSCIQHISQVHVSVPVYNNDFPL